MKKTMRFLNLAALVAMGAVMAACAKEDELGFQEELPGEIEEEVVTLTASVGIASEPETRALAVDGNNLAKTFAENDCIAVVYTNTGGTTVKALSAALTSSDITNSGKSANFTVTLTNPDRTKVVKYIYPAAMANDNGSVNYAALATQDGILEHIASNLDYCEYSGSWNAGALPTGTMTNQLAYLALTLKDATGSSEITGSVTSMTISDGTHTYAVTRAAAAGPIYVAIQPTASADIEITAVDNSYHYSKSLTGKTYASGQCYNLGWRMAVDLTATPMTIEALTAGTVNVVMPNGFMWGMKYSVNGGAKTLIYSATDIPVSAGDKVQFYGNGTSTPVYYSDSDKARIKGSGAGFTCKAYGNIMSLLDETDFATMTTLPDNESIFCELFYYNTTLTDASDLLLPATTLADFCYNEMFKNCSALTAAPELPATTLATGCYWGIFRNCPNLNSVKCFATSGINENGSTDDWLNGVAATGTLYIASGTGATWPAGANGIPSGWTWYYPDGSHPLSLVTAKYLGKVIGADGNIYETIARATNAGTTAVAVIAYVGSDTDDATFNHGLAITLTDEGSMSWNTSKSTCEGKTAVSGAKWCLPSQNQWNTMLSANGGSASSFTGLNTTITNAGGTALAEAYYWSSTSSSADYAYDLSLSGGYAHYISSIKSSDSYVRACLVF